MTHTQLAILFLTTGAIIMLVAIITDDISSSALIMLVFANGLITRGTLFLLTRNNKSAPSTILHCISYIHPNGDLIRKVCTP